MSHLVLLHFFFAKAKLANVTSAPGEYKAISHDPIMVPTRFQICGSAFNSYDELGLSQRLIPSMSQTATASVSPGPGLVVDKTNTVLKSTAHDLTILFQLNQGRNTQKFTRQINSKNGWVFGMINNSRDVLRSWTIGIKQDWGRAQKPSARDLFDLAIASDYKMSVQNGLPDLYCPCTLLIMVRIFTHKAELQILNKISRVLKPKLRLGLDLCFGKAKCLHFGTQFFKLMSGECV